MSIEKPTTKHIYKGNCLFKFLYYLLLINVLHVNLKIWV